MITSWQSPMALPLSVSASPIHLSPISWGRGTANRGGRGLAKLGFLAPTKWGRGGRGAVGERVALASAITHSPSRASSELPRSAGARKGIRR